MSEVIASKKRWAWLAVTLSVIMPGVGHVYCGKLTRGLVFGLLYGVVTPTTLGLLAYNGPASTVVFALLLVAALIGIIIAAVLDSYRTAIRTKADYELKSYNRLIIYVLIGALVQGSCVGYTLYVRGSLFEAFRVPAASDYPTIYPGDRILVDKIAYRKHNPIRGDLVLFHPPNENWRVYNIKRVIAVGGDTVEMKDGLIYVNGEKLELRKIGPATIQITKGQGRGNAVKGETFKETNGNARYEIFIAPSVGGATTDFQKITVPEHHCFVIGDNRNNSLDSRQFGPIPYATVNGRIDYIYWPSSNWSRFGRIGNSVE